MTALWAILATGAGTYFSRAVFIIVLANRRIPAPVRRAMEYVGPSVMAALVVTMLVTPEGELTVDLPKALALGVAALAAWKTRNHLVTLALAMAVFWGSRALVGG